MTDVSDRARALVAELLGYRDWDDATDYRTTGEQDRQRDKAIALVSRFERDILAGQSVPEDDGGEHITEAAKRMAAVQGMDWAELDGGDIGYWESLAAEALATPAPDSPAIPEGSRPALCRNALRDAGKPYPRSGCAVCKNGGMIGCPYERNAKPTPASHTALTDAIDTLSGIAQPSAGVLSIDQANALGVLIRHASDSHTAPDALSFQIRVQPWMMECFGAEIAADLVERTDRATEEMLELSQAICAKIGVDFAPRAHALVDYVAGRPVGEPAQEVGGVMVTLAALCLAAGLDMHDAGEIELARITQPEIVQKIRAKQAAKPTGSALPIAALATPASHTAPEDEYDSALSLYRFDTGKDLARAKEAMSVVDYRRSLNSASHTAPDALRSAARELLGWYGPFNPTKHPPEINGAWLRLQAALVTPAPSDRRQS